MKKLLVLFVFVMATLTVAVAQVTSTNGGAIQGTITDASGAEIPGATVLIVNKETGFTKSITTDSAGYYSVGPLNPGPYTVTVSAPGFQNLAVNTAVRIGTASPGTFKLIIGKASETVEVNAGAVQLNTDQAGVSDVLTSQQIDSLPINGRNFLDVAQIEPGVILQSGQSFDPTKAGYSALSVSGVSGRTTRILLDGQDITDETVGTTIFNVSQGAIGEFQLNRSTQDVSGDVTSTGQVLVGTKSGTNGLHGELFYNFQDYRALFATEFGASVPFQRNQYGGSIGGPIWKDKLFFFGNVERIKQDSSTPAGVGSLFPQFQGLSIPSPYRETYSTIRLDYNGPFAGHYFVRVNYNVNAVAGNFGNVFEVFANRDNTPGIAAGADYQFGHFTHSFRGSYEKFHNLISDASSASPINLLPGITFQNVVQGLETGPNLLAPQGTYQSDKQLRYDGSWTKGAHTVRYGYSLNRIQGGGFAAFFGLAPRVRETSTTAFKGAVGCGGVAGAASCLSDPLMGYHASSIVLGNGLGFFTENSGFGLIGGGVADWREGAYVADSWKATPNFTVTAGLRWSVDTGRANQDVPVTPCSALDTTNVFNNGDPLPCTGSTPLFSAFRSDLGAKVHQPYANFGPQAGIIYSLPDRKTVLSAGFGIFYEGDVFNNTTNARTGLLASGPFFNFQSVCGAGKFQQPDGTIVSSATVNGNTLSIRQICSAPIGTAAPFAIALQQVYQANSAKNALSSNGGFIGETLNATGLYGAPYRTPYSEQWNFGVQRELTKGATLQANYIHNSTLKIAQTQDVNHVGAARFFNKAAAQNAIAATTVGFGCAGGSTAAAINCAIGNGAQITDFAGNGLDSGNTFLGGAAPAANGVTVATGAAFPGANPLLGSGAFLLPIGRSGYDAFQVVFKEQKAHPFPGIDGSNLQISYNLSRVVTSSGGGSDQFFSSASFDEDNPNAYIGRAGLDRKHQLSLGGSILIKKGPVVGIIGHFYSALPSTLTLDASNPVGAIFQSDVTGDGTTGDLVPGTLPGAYQHDVKATTLGAFITNFNSTQAGKLTPAGQALISSGLFTQAQLVALNATVQSLPALPQAVALSNPPFRSLDVTFSYPIRLSHYIHALGEAATLQPGISFYNVANFSNFGGGGGNPNVAGLSGDLGAQGPGALNGPTDFLTHDTFRVSRQPGTYDQGAPRTTEFQLKFTF
ncbi:MAG: TonB-dependent receptor [Acidobacteriaceae bacterium]